MGLRDQINDSLKEAMKSGDKRRVSTLRLVNSAIKDRDIQNRTAGPDAGVNDAQIVEVLAKMVKQRQESLESMKRPGATNLPLRSARRSRSSRATCQNSCRTKK